MSEKTNQKQQELRSTTLRRAPASELRGPADKQESKTQPARSAAKEHLLLGIRLASPSFTVLRDWSSQPQESSPPKESDHPRCGPRNGAADCNHVCNPEIHSSEFYPGKTRD